MSGQDRSEATARATEPETPTVSVTVPTERALRRRLLSPSALAVSAMIFSLAAMAQTIATRRHVAATQEMELQLRDLRRVADSIAAASSPLYDQFLVWRAIRDYSPSVDLRTDELQGADDGFSVGQLSVSEVPGGARITGIVVNTQAVHHHSASFRISTLGVSREFSVMNLPSGGSSRFSVTVTGVDPVRIESGQIRYVSSTINYRRPD